MENETSCRNRDAAILGLLEPVIRAAIPRTALLALTTQLHALILDRAAGDVQRSALLLPVLSPLTEMPLGQRVWCPVPGMYGGFEYWLTHAGSKPRLLVNTWCRIVRGAELCHAVTPEGISDLGCP